MSAPPKGKRLGTKMRGDAQAAYTKRGAARARLWRSYSAKANKDVTFVGDACYLHFLTAESDPGVRTVRYADLDADALPAGWHHSLSAEVVTSDNVLQLRFVHSARAEIADVAAADLAVHAQARLKTDGSPCRRVESVSITDDQLIFGNEINLQNWHRLMPWLAQARFHSLGRYRAAVSDRLATGSRIRAMDILAMAGSEEESALYLAATIRGVGDGSWRSDLHERPFGGNTVFLQGKRK